MKIEKTETIILSLDCEEAQAVLRALGEMTPGLYKNDLQADKGSTMYEKLKEWLDSD